MHKHAAQPMSEWFFWFFLIGFLLTAIFWIAFARFSMARIEREMKKDNLPDTFLWDGLGGRIVFYALAITLPEKTAQKINRLIDVTQVKSYSKKQDATLGLLFLISANTWIIISLIAMAFGLD